MCVWIYILKAFMFKTSLANMGAVILLYRMRFKNFHQENKQGKTHTKEKMYSINLLCIGKTDRCYEKVFSCG